MLRSLPFVLVVLSACASSTDSTSGGSGGSTTGAPGGGGPGGTGGIGGGGGAGGEPISVGGSGGGADDAILYVHSNNTLFTAAPSITPLELTMVGDFNCVGGQNQDPTMTDIAVSDAGDIWGISENNVYRLEVTGSMVHCAATIPLANPGQINFYGLTFAPKGTLDASVEVLVAANSAGELWSIDEGGQLKQRGTFGNVPANDGNGHAYQNAGKPWELSGDITFVANGGNPVGFATVRDCPNPPSPQGCNPIDTLVDLDVGALATATTGSILKSVRGQIVHRDGCTDSTPGYGSVYGVAAWQDKVFGFSRVPENGGGYAIDIDNADGTACLIQAFPATQWAGAGITTLAPVRPPPPK